jgi:hypothetical protein
MQKIAASWLQAASLDDESTAALMQTYCQQLSRHRVGHRPNRVEPSAVKRRPKPHELLTKPRDEARAALLGSKP